MNRRNLIRTGAAALVPAVMLSGHTRAAELQLLTLDDPIAKALNYVEDATEADGSNQRGNTGPDGNAQRCSNCALYVAVADEAGTCAAIPGKLVKGAGWCSAWVPAA